jgi:hypothetical protein
MACLLRGTGILEMQLGRVHVLKNLDLLNLDQRAISNLK